MATAQAIGAPPSGLDAEFMALPHDQQTRGVLGTETGVTPPTPERRTGRDPEDFTGLGELLEADDATAFKAIDELVVRQEPLAISRLHQDRHWTNIKLGLTWSTLEKQQDTSQYKQSFPPGTESLRPSAVPNKQADLANKLTETLLVDLPKPAPKAENESERARRGAEMAKEFLTQDGTEAGTNDGELFWAQIEGATTRASTFNHYWVDPTGGGSIAKQIKAHPFATDPAHPLDAVDPATGQPVPTTDYVLRYVTADGAFTTNPADADRQWVPKICIEKWGREHLRLYPEDRDLHGCQSAIGLFYCTLGEARRRWPVVAKLDDVEQGHLCDWLPRRYLALLPLALRARWQKTEGKVGDPKGTSHDERLVFYYAYYRKADTEYPKGAALYINGTDGGFALGKDTLTAEVEVPSEHAQDEMVTDVRTMDLPLVQMRLLQDPDEKDPMGKAFLARIGGAGEATALLINGYLEAMDQILHPARFATSTSPLTHEDVEESRTMGTFATVLGADDFPKYEELRPLPVNFLNTVNWVYEQMDSAGSQNKPSQGSDTSKEVSGIARKIAVDQAMVSMSRMQQAATRAWERHWRVKLQLAMKHFSVPQLLRYVGVDGASKQEWFTGNDFAAVGGITMMAGTGTMMPPQEKVNYLAQLVGIGFMPMDEAGDAARPAFTTALGVPDNVHQQRIERQVSSWLEGPPEGWVEQYRQYAQAKQAFDAQQAAAQQAQTPAPGTPEAAFKAFTDKIAADAVQAAVQLVAKTVETKDFGGDPAAAQKAQTDAAVAKQKIDASAATHQQDLQFEREKHQQGMAMQQEQHALKLHLAAHAPAKKPGEDKE